MNNTQNAAIVLLLVSAAILTAVVVGIFTGSSQSALADGSAREGDYTLVTGAFSQDVDVLYVIDIGAKRMHAYVVNRNNKTLDLLDRVDLERAFR